MKALRNLLFALLAAVAIAAPVCAQTTIYNGAAAALLTNVSSPGPSASYSVLPANHSYTFTVVPSGTVSSCTVNLEGSLDNVHWFALGIIDATDAGWSSTAGEMVHVANKPVNYLRANVTAISGGGTVTAAVALYQ